MVRSAFLGRSNRTPKVATVGSSRRSATLCRSDLSIVMAHPPRRASGSLPLITNRYRNPCQSCKNAWWIWFGRIDSTNLYQGRSPYQIPQRSDMCRRLPNSTNCYQGFLLALPRPWVTFTRAPPPLDDITHSGLDYVLCWVITIVLMWLRQALV